MENELQPQIPPIAAPTGEVTAAPPAPTTPIDLRALALWHRRMLWALLFSCVMDVTFAMSRVDDFDHAAPMALLFFFGAGLLTLAASIARCITVLKVAQTLRDFGPWLAAVMSLVGCFGFFIILNFNGWAKKRLRAAGIRVGFLGASVKNVPV